MAILAPVYRRISMVNPRWMIVLVVATVTLQTALYRPHTFMHLIQWNETTTPVFLEECPQSLLFLDDTGRMGNRFFEFLAAKMFAEQLNRVLYINQQFSDLLLSYFNGLHTPGVEFRTWARNLLETLLERAIFNPSRVHVFFQVSKFPSTILNADLRRTRLGLSS